MSERKNTREEIEYVHKQGITPFEVEYYCYQSRWATDLSEALSLFQGDTVIRLIPDDPEDIIVIHR